MSTEKASSTGEKDTMTTTTTQTPTDEDVLKQLIEWLETRVTINTGFVPDPETGYLTHQLLQITCGDYVTVSNPEPLGIPLKPLSGDELKEVADITIN